MFFSLHVVNEQILKSNFICIIFSNILFMIILTTPHLPHIKIPSRSFLSLNTTHYNALLTEHIKHIECGTTTNFHALCFVLHVLHTFPQINWLGSLFSRLFIYTFLGWLMYGETVKQLRARITLSVRFT